MGSKNIPKHFFSLALYVQYFSIILFSLTFHRATSTSKIARNETDRLSLLAFKSKIIPDSRGLMESWNDSIHFCDWAGVTCGKRHRRVVVINLSSSGLAGTLSPHIGNLSFLREIRLQNNSLQGEIPREIGRLFRLQVLHLLNNSLIGEIPASNLSRCTRLQYLNFGRNKLTGKIPLELESLKNLRALGLHFNNLKGGIPHFLGNLSSLEALSLSYNPLGGTIPNSLSQLKNLHALGLGGNDLFGTIPESIYNISTISIFALSQNRLHGSLPKSLGFHFPHLEHFQFSENFFHGNIPLSLSNCSKLEVVELFWNSFSGKMRIDFGGMKNLNYLNLGRNYFGSGDVDEMSFLDSLANCSNLEVLTLGVNRFEGVLPDSIGNLSSRLGRLLLNRNRLHGRIPSGISTLVNLYLLGMENNFFTGPIPGELGKLQNLQWFAIDNNRLSGKIPYSLGNMSSLMELRLNKNYLEGNIPRSLKQCQSLLVLELSDNKFSGGIPKQIFDITHLSLSLNLARNNLVGPIPLEIGKMRDLMEFDVSNNKLSGEIPSSIGSCTMLENLYVQGNRFEGSIPLSLRFLRGIQVIDLSHNNLSGEIPMLLESSPVKKLNLSFNHLVGKVPTNGVFANLSSVSIMGNKDLCGGIAQLKLPMCTIDDKKASKKWIIIALTASLGFVLASIALFCWFGNRNLPQVLEFSLRKSLFNVSYNKLRRATNEFSSENLIGMGSFGSVYKGALGPQQEKLIAVKVFDLQKSGATKSFLAECRALRNIRHRNLVRVITVCSSTDFRGNDFKALVYEFMPNGSLENWLHYDSPAGQGSVELGNPQCLSFLQRVSIALDVAFALDYLHHSYYKPVIHCDLKPSNILLDEDMTARVGDFGLMKFHSVELASAVQSSSIGVKGTIGYTPPEYGLGSEASTKGDIYSYGIILLEMMTGKRPTDPIFGGDLDLHNYARLALSERAIEIVDPNLVINDHANHNETSTTREQITRLQREQARRREECLVAIIKIGVACSMESPQDRIGVREVVRELQLVRNILSGPRPRQT